jgi:3-oxoacyl-[acyl-carrier-protein] synthase II
LRHRATGNFNPTHGSIRRLPSAGRFVFRWRRSLILENLDHALNRNARIYAEVVGHASSCDGYSIASPDPEGAGAIRAMRWALADGKIEPTQVDYINAHGTSTPLNDAGETNSIKKVFGNHAYKVAISSIKSMIGHALGASGALEAIACALTIYESIIPPTINYLNPDPVLDLDYVPIRQGNRMFV